MSQSEKLDFLYSSRFHSSFSFLASFCSSIAILFKLEKSLLARKFSVPLYIHFMVLGIVKKVDAVPWVCTHQA